MARKFNPSKIWRRAIEFPSSDPSVQRARWVLEITAQGVAFHRHGQPRAHSLTWRQIISYGLMHGVTLDRRIERLIEKAAAAVCAAHFNFQWAAAALEELLKKDIEPLLASFKEAEEAGKKWREAQPAPAPAQEGKP